MRNFLKISGEMKKTFIQGHEFGRLVYMSAICIVVQSDQFSAIIPLP